MHKWIWGRWPLLVVAMLLIAFGAYGTETDGDRVWSSIIIAIGIMTLGSWITTEVVDWWTSAAEREEEANRARSDD